MADYLLEIGCEEIPARMIDRAVEDLAAGLAARLESEALAATGAVERFAGPRRLAVILRQLPDRQPDRSERIVGPPADRAFAADGTPTRAATAFAEKLGIAVSELQRVDTAKGTCVAGTKHTPGAMAAAVLSRVVPEVVLGLHFAKMMRWGTLSVRFVRPIRSLLSLLAGDVVEFTIAGIAAGRNSFGHRFLGQPVLPLATADDYVRTMAAGHVIARGDDRRQAIAAQLDTLARSHGGSVERDDDLLAEVVHLAEEPHVVAGCFDPAYLELPSEVLVTSIKHHQKGFPVWIEPGKRLAPAMLAVASIPDREGHIARGIERVLNARLADARFFWQEDVKRPLGERSAALERVVFHEKLGSYAAKSRRLTELAPRVAEHYGLAPVVVRAAGEAARLAKLDLTTGMVGEFPELQGIIGGLYLRAEGADAAVASAVYEHYRPLSLEGEPPATVAGQVLAAADKIDTLVGFFGCGLIPSGTKDPFGLRRAAQGLVRTVLALGQDGDLGVLLVAASEGHQSAPGAAAAATALAALGSYLGERVAFVLAGQGHRPDTIACVQATDPLNLVDLARRARALTAARERESFEQTFTVFKRVANIAGAGGESTYDTAAFREPAERDLAAALDRVKSEVAAAGGGRDPERTLARLGDLRQPLHTFFEAVFVMDPDLRVRENRLRLLRAIAALVQPIGDFSQLQVEREGKA